MMTGLYIHIPFCASKCAYCDFCSRPPGDEAETERMVRCLCAELQTVPDDFTPDTVYIGGGSPSLLDENAWIRIFQTLESRFSKKDRDQGLEKSFTPREWTVEMNPGQVRRDILDLLRGRGVNRISLGVQTLDDRLLRRLGRAHAANDALRALDLLSEAGFDNISADLMYGIPEQTEQRLAEDIDRLIAPSVTHISAYALSLEPGARMYDRMRDGYLTLPDDDTVAAMYETIRSRLAAAGFEQYELSNWSRPGYRCLHNRIYWEGGNYIGIGPSAHSYWK